MHGDTLQNRQLDAPASDDELGQPPRVSKDPQEWIHLADYKLLFENNHMGVATTDPQFRFVRVNRAFERMTGYSAEALVNGMNLGHLSPDPESAEKSKAMIEMLYSREIESFEIEKTYRCADGSLMEALTSVTATYLEDGSLAGCTAFIIDVSERRKMERDLNEALKVMQATQEELIRSEKLASLGALVAGIAHEINTPIGNCLTIASSLEGRIGKLKQDHQASNDPGDCLDQAVGKLEKGAHLLVANLRRAADLIANFKQVAVDRSTGAKRAFHLHTLVNEVLSTIKHITGNRIEFHLEIPETIRFESYPGELGRVFNNLIENAVIHGFPEGRHGHIWVVAKFTSAVEDSVEIVVKDDGVGMDSKLTDKVFDPFFTTKLGTGGSGLGMHISYGIVTKLLQGKCHFESQQGTGSEFKMIIPLIVGDLQQD